MGDKQQKRRAGDGGTYLIIADDTPEFSLALHYAAHMAQLHSGHVAMARIIEPSEFLGWGGIENAAKAEARAKAEAEMQKIADSVMHDVGIMPSFIIREGEMLQAIVDIANGNPALSAIVLATNTKGESGALVQYFSAKGLRKISVPVIIVPGHAGVKKP